MNKNRNLLHKFENMKVEIFIIPEEDKNVEKSL